MEETPLKGKDERKTKGRKLKKILPKVKDDFSVRAEKEESLLRLDEKEVNHLMKYAMFDQEQKRGDTQSARNLGNWYYNGKEDSYTHPDGWCYRFRPIKHQKTETDFQEEIKVYYADESESAPQKGLYRNERYQHLKNKECQALLSPQGRQIFAQRKIVFG